MKKIKFNGHVLLMYDSIQELPVYRFQLYNLNLLLDSGIGSDLTDFDSRCNKVRRLMIDDQESASRELFNLQQGVRLLISKTSPKMRSFVVMIHKIDGFEITDDCLTDEGISDLIKELSKKRLPIKNVFNFLNALKKKIDLEFEHFFPGVMDSAKVKEFYSKLKNRSMLILQSVIDPSESNQDKIELIEKFIFTSLKPKNFHGPKGVEVQTIKGFEETCILLNQHNVSSNPRRMTTLSFYQALEVVKDQLKPKK